MCKQVSDNFPAGRQDFSQGVLIPRFVVIKYRCQNKMHGVRCNTGIPQIACRYKRGEIIPPVMGSHQQQLADQCGVPVKIVTDKTLDCRFCQPLDLFATRAVFVKVVHTEPVCPFTDFINPVKQGVITLKRTTPFNRITYKIDGNGFQVHRYVFTPGITDYHTHIPKAVNKKSRLINLRSVP